MLKPPTQPSAGPWKTCLHWCRKGLGRLSGVSVAGPSESSWSVSTLNRQDNACSLVKGSQTGPSVAGAASSPSSSPSLPLSAAQALDPGSLWDVGLPMRAGHPGHRRGAGSHRHRLLCCSIPLSVPVVALLSLSALCTETARCGGS